MDKRNISIGITLFVVLGFGYVTLSNTGTLGNRPTPTPAVVLTDFENLVTASGTLVPVRARQSGLQSRGAGGEGSGQARRHGQARCCPGRARVG